jgi:hypothetical protein
MTTISFASHLFAPANIRHAVYPTRRFDDGSRPSVSVTPGAFVPSDPSQSGHGISMRCSSRSVGEKCISAKETPGVPASMGHPRERVRHAGTNQRLVVSRLSVLFVGIPVDPAGDASRGSISTSESCGRYGNQRFAQIELKRPNGRQLSQNVKITVPKYQTLGPYSI